MAKPSKPGSEPEVVTDISRCREIMNGILATGEPIVLDAEGVRLNAVGPLTLLQLMTSQGDIYLFDILENPDLILKGDIREVLENSDIRKVMHGCFSDSGALYHQFDKIRLENVFDTAEADVVIEERVNGHKFPRHLRLSDLVEKYGGQVDDAKSLQAVWMKDDEFWAKRPLNPSMIKYAAADVRMLYPNVYQKLLSLIEKNNLWQHFQDQVYETINEQIEVDEVKKMRRKRIHSSINMVLTDLEGKKDGGSHKDLSDDQKVALWKSLEEDIPVSKAIQGIRTSFFTATLDEMEKEKKSDGRNFVLKKFTTQDHEKILTLSKKRTTEGVGHLAQRASTFLRELSKFSSQRIVSKVNDGYDLYAKEKTALMQVDTDILTAHQAGILRDEKKQLTEKFEADIKKSLKGKAENFMYLRRNESYLLKTIPEKYLCDDCVKKAKSLLLQSN